MEDSADRLAEVIRRVARAGSESGRDPEGITLVAVSKLFDVESIVPVIEAGQRVFGENRVQEAAQKYPGLRARWPDLEVHLIGPLQTNKVRDAVRLFDVIHTVDRDRVAAALGAEIRAQGRNPGLMVQVNTGEEPQKAGIVPAEVDDFVKRCREEYGLAISGLMCIPPAEEPPSAHFGLLRKIGDRLGLPLLSMGMSGDFEEAIALGATHVRVGSAIFGERVR